MIYYKYMSKNKILVIGNDDKDDWSKNDDAKASSNNVNQIKRADKILYSGLPSSGKTNLMMNMIMNTHPEFDHIYIKTAHKYSQEYDIINYTRISSLHEFNDIDFKKIKDEKQKILIVLEDTNELTINKNNKIIEELFSFHSSHYGHAICVLSQSPIDISRTLRRMLNVYYIMKNSDISFIDRINTIPRNHKKILQHIITNATGQYDFLKIDLNDKQRYYLNFEPLKI